MQAELAEKAGFTDYTFEMDNNFKSQNVVIKPLPERYNGLAETKCSIIKITSCKQFWDFLCQEKQFWTKLNGEGKDYLKCLNTVNLSLKSLEAAKTAYAAGDSYYKKKYLNDACYIIQQNYLYSKADLAKYISKMQNKNNYFFSGFDSALQNLENSQLNYNNASCLEGFIEGLNYRKTKSKELEKYKEVLADYTDNIKEAADNFSKLNNEYTVAFYEQERRIEEINGKSNSAIQNLEEESQKFLADKSRRFTELEKLYSEKLKLEKPAEYWKKMSDTYSKQGKNWLILSVSVAVAIIAMLICVIVFAPEVFGKDTHLYDIIKNSAIITVIAGVAVYLLRTFIKMALSSVHLSRDAKEREQLSYFYLALIANGAVSEKEQALIINSLFSRSDTGLLKGDSSPSMTANVSEMVDKLNAK